MSDKPGFDYVALANRTKSTSYYPEQVESSYFLRELDAAIAALNSLDRIKKALFYGKPLHPGRIGLPTGSQDCGELPLHLLADSAPIAVDIVHGIIGKATEAGELLEALYEALGGRQLDHVNVAEEVGDGQWYDAVLAKALGFTFDTVQRVNIAKLEKRYPEKYSDIEAINRDLGEERVVLDSIKTQTINEGKLVTAGLGLGVTNTGRELGKAVDYRLCDGDIDD